MAKSGWKVICNMNESTAGADASVEALKLYHMKLTLAYSSLLAPIAIVACQSASGSLHHRYYNYACIVQKMGNDRRDRC